MPLLLKTSDKYHEWSKASSNFSSSHNSFSQNCSQLPLDFTSTDADVKSPHMSPPPSAAAAALLLAAGAAGGAGAAPKSPSRSPREELDEGLWRGVWGGARSFRIFTTFYLRTYETLSRHSHCNFFLNIFLAFNELTFHFYGGHVHQKQPIKAIYTTR